MSIIESNFIWIIPNFLSLRTFLVSRSRNFVTNTEWWEWYSTSFLNRVLLSHLVSSSSNIGIHLRHLFNREFSYPSASRLCRIFLLRGFLWVSFFDARLFFSQNFSFFCFYIGAKRFSAVEKNITSNNHEKTSRNLSEVIQYNLIMVNEKYSYQDNRHGPYDWSDHIIEPKTSLTHPTWSSDKRNKCSCKVMKFSEYYIPEAISLDLSVKDMRLCFADSKPVSIAFYELFSIPFSDPVAEIVPEHGTTYRHGDCEREVHFPPKSTYENHNIHTWHSCSDDGQTLYARREKCDEIIPVSENLHEFSDPYYSVLDPIRFYEWYDNQDKCHEREKYRESFRDILDYFFQCLFHSLKIAKRRWFAKRKCGFLEKIFDKFVWQKFSIEDLFQNKTKNSEFLALW